ncbi:3-keto-disaccharide hydrolase [Noviherbaspirillum massiliense]|uniref:3-keto-disaccharide hydrolase n=1 Tax=Noviherbaspirillum massiliense TaxID=1465823 RepID=UPI00035F1ED9|nr:DUF1080 domain-containing protein [Noviherbaspirillum massiliense]
MNRLLSTILSLLGVAMLVAGCASKASTQADSGWVTLIDGAKGLDNWKIVGDANWNAADGVIQADKKTSKDHSFLLTRNSYTDFQIRAEFWASDDANSGIFMRCEDLSNIADKTCYEANIFDQRPDPTYGTGAIVHVAKVVPMPKAGGKWNTYDITVKGTHLTVALNGVRTVDVDDSRHKSGPIALQYAGGAIKFRKVQIKPL